MKMQVESTRSSQPYRVFILDDHPMTRHGIVRLIEEERDMVCCGQTGETREALGLVEKTKPNIVLSDITLPGGHGLEFIKDLKALHPETLILVVSMHDEMVYAERALSAGARGYLMKSEGGEKLVEAIRHVLQGKVYLSENMSGRIRDVFRGRHRDGTITGKLTDREFEVFCLLGQGLTTREIGQHMRLSLKTVETHRLHVRDKLQIKSGAALVQYAVRWTASHNVA